MTDKKEISISHCGVTLSFELYSYQHILDNLKKVKDGGGIEEIYEYTIPDKNPFKTLKSEHVNKTYYFTYIKFIEDKKTKELYGIVGGKTNYSYPDISFDGRQNDNDKRLSRIFLENNEEYEYSRSVIVIDHAPVEIEDEQERRKRDEQQALFIETYIQRKFNLLNS